MLAIRTTTTPTIHPIRSNAMFAVAHAGLFMLVYNGCLLLTSLRPDVRRMFGQWELHVPLVPAMIIPYFSIYGLFILSFFLCSDQGELRLLSRRLAMSQLVAGAVYMLFPLENGYHRPVVEGFFGPLFRLLDSTDLPYNLAPSLHVTTAIILGAHYAAKTRGIVRQVLVGWFTLIAASTMLTWQHHLLDVVAGTMLGLACLRMGGADGAGQNLWRAISLRTRRSGLGSF
jgi:membrane-associated phospholipid phosphatase